MIVPNIFQLSSGETSLFDIFLSILRDFELSGSQFSNAADIRGIVVVDEMDLHLHAVHQHEVLPSLIGMFPKVDSFVERPVRDGPWSARVSGREAPRAVGC